MNTDTKEKLGTTSDVIAQIDLFLNEDERLTPEQKKKILRLRAKNLSEELQDETIGSDNIDIVEFTINDETYGLNTEFVKQVAKIRELAKIPCTPDHILGITSLYEQITSVVDIRVFFDFPLSTKKNDFNIIVLHSDKMEFAIHADKVIGVRTVPKKNIQTSIGVMDDARKKYFYGITKDQTIILDGAKMLSEMAVSE